MELRPKALAVYQSVLDMMDEGADLNSMTVAEIAERAGIGKGTAYEYFRSKDELLVRALQYDYYLNCRRIEEALEKGKTFREDVEVMFEQIELCSANKRLTMQFLKLLDEIREKDETCVREHVAEELKIFTTLLDRVREMGQKEGCISSSIPPECVRLELGSKFMGYYIFLQTEKPEEERTEMKNFLYHTMIKSLG